MPVSVAYEQFSSGTLQDDTESRREKFKHEHIKRKQAENKQKFDCTLITLELNRIDVEVIFHVKEVYMQLKEILVCCNS